MPNWLSPRDRIKIELPQPRESEPIWLLTLADLLSLMLCFFVVLYAMQAPKVKEWEQISSSFKQRFGVEQETVQPIPGIEQQFDQSADPASLHYHYRVLVEQIAAMPEPRPEALLEQDRIIVRLSSDVFFQPGKADIIPNRRGQLSDLLTAMERTGLEMAIIGHTDPAPIRNQSFSSNWALSLARALTVAEIVQNAGGGQNHKIWGAAAGNYGEISQDLDLASRYSKARRVDLVLTLPNL